ncbi:acyltransferase family protein [Candidatus Saccharibacteria bacterium]|nr:acyltransferase family protein [Candidatus Saccharibacteria bacterium]
MRSSSKKLLYFWKKRTVVLFVLAIFVVIAHTAGLHPLTGVAVPLFFIISGATFFRDYNPKKYKTKIKSRFQSLFLPFILWNTIALLFFELSSLVPFSGRSFEPLGIQDIIEGVFFYKYNYAFWFLYNLIFFVLITPIFDFFAKSKFRAFLFIAFCLTLPYLCGDLFAFLKLNAESVVFYAIGCTIGKHAFNDFAKRPNVVTNNWKYIIIITICITIRVLIERMVWNMPLIMEQVCLAIYCFAFWKFIDVFLIKVKIRNFMDTPFLIYAMHPNLSATIMILFPIIFGEGQIMSIVNCVIAPIITVLLIIAVATFWRKFMPKSYALFSGGR